jgi:hypothetical protein
MKNKRVLYIFLALFFIVGAVLLSSALFSVNSVLLSPESETTLLDGEKLQAETRAFIGKNIFFLDEENITAKLEEDNPYIKVINIERVFPSIVKVHYWQRKPLFEIRVEQGFAIIDSDGKVLEISQTSKNLTRLESEYSGSIAAGSFITDESVEDAALLYKAFSMITEDERMYDESLFNAYFISVKKESPGVMNLKTRAGAVLRISDYKTETAQKIYYGLYIFEEELDDYERATQTIEAQV